LATHVLAILLAHTQQAGPSSRTLVSECTHVCARVCICVCHATLRMKHNA